jgi:hypothetical protein
MYAWGDDDLPDEEVDKILQAIAKRIHAYGMDTAAIITLETVKPLSNLGTELSRMFFSPFLPILGPEYNLLGDKLLFIFQKRTNVEKLITILENMTREEEDKRKEEKAKKKADKKTAEDKKPEPEPNKFVLI